MNSPDYVEKAFCRFQTEDFHQVVSLVGSFILVIILLTDFWVFLSFSQSGNGIAVGFGHLSRPSDQEFDIADFSPSGRAKVLEAVAEAAIAPLQRVGFGHDRLEPSRALNIRDVGSHEDRQ